MGRQFNPCAKRLKYEKTSVSDNQRTIRQPENRFAGFQAA
ncbi:hypothetical protein GCWU000324_00087 [Kingella oralis ATCC 51147]|uniref:Uncharacterized protein n=1 Tax=Kingella oralis ATCC 51147 TaxID=629741 RepID=C4GEK0_9NEIS|nr:hypothetical protein GCWU000324_00087 [Kingella oralis ATCC 51147]